MNEWPEESPREEVTPGQEPEVGARGYGGGRSESAVRCCNCGELPLADALSGFPKKVTVWNLPAKRSLLHRLGVRRV